jgi:hypothetical protein
MNRIPGAREPQDGRLNESMAVLAFETPWSFTSRCQKEAAIELA